MGILYQHKHKLDKAIMCYEEAVELDSNFKEAWNNLGDVYSAKREYQKAIKYYENIQEYSKIIECYEEIIKFNPNIIEAWNNLGSVYMTNDQYEKAVAFFDVALKLDPKYVKAQNNKAMSYFKQKEFWKAAKNFQKSIEIDPENQETWKLPIFECYDEITKNNKSDVAAWINKGNMYGYKKEEQNAIECYEKAFEIDPHNAPARYNLNIAIGKAKPYEHFVFVKPEK